MPFCPNLRPTQTLWRGWGLSCGDNCLKMCTKTIFLWGNNTLTAVEKEISVYRNTVPFESLQLQVVFIPLLPFLFSLPHLSFSFRFLASQGQFLTSPALIPLECKYLAFYHMVCQQNFIQMPVAARTVMERNRNVPCHPLSCRDPST